MRQNTQWRDLTRAQQTWIVLLSSVELTLTTIAALDLARRPAERLRGRKAWWWPALFVQPFGPVLYLTLGRLQEREESTDDDGDGRGDRSDQEADQPPGSESAGPPLHS